MSRISFRSEPLNLFGTIKLDLATNSRSVSASELTAAERFVETPVTRPEYTYACNIIIHNMALYAGRTNSPILRFCPNITRISHARFYNLYTRIWNGRIGIYFYNLRYTSARVIIIVIITMSSF